MKSGRIVGIDLGTTNSLVAVVDSGLPMVMADAAGQRLTPSVVCYATPHSSVDSREPLVGHAARRLWAIHPRDTVYSVKRFMGRREKEIDDAERRMLYSIGSNSAGDLVVKAGGMDRMPEEISAAILKKLKTDVEMALGESVSRAVITVPAYFNDRQRAATKRAGELAGWSVERILNEPTAAALAYGLGRLKEHSKIAVYDLGGGTFDLSILEMQGGVFQVLATHGNTRLGGDDIDALLAAELSAKFAEIAGDDFNSDPAARVRLRESAEAAKVLLSTASETSVTLPFLSGSRHLDCSITRRQLEQIAAPVVERTREHCLRALADARLEPSALDQVVLVGGQTRMPLVRRKVSEWFECAEFEETSGEIRVGEKYHRRSGPELNTSQNPDEAVALGAAIQGEILAGGLQQVLLLDVTPLSLGIETFGGLMNVIIPRNSTIPVKAGEVFTNAASGQRGMLIHVLQGERERAVDNWTLGRFSIDFQPAVRGTARVGVQFEIDADGILNVLTRDLETGNETAVDFKSVVDVEDEKVLEMVEASVAHAFDDLASRRWIEAANRARECVDAARLALEECGKKFEPIYLSQVGQCMQKIERLLGTAHGQPAGTGDPDALKSALHELDHITQPLADRLIEEAVGKRI